MKRIGYVISALLLSMVAGAAGAGDEAGLTATLRQVVENNLAAYNRKDVSGTMQSIHTKSPDYTGTQRALPKQFDALDAQTKLVRFHYIGHDDEFAVARVKLRIVDQSERAVRGEHPRYDYHISPGRWCMEVPEQARSRRGALAVVALLAA